jgi:hypothetical protein
MKLLTENNTKILKSIDHGYLTVGLHLAPADLSGHEVCRGRSPGCTESCLNTSGHGAMTVVQRSRIAKTKLLFDWPDKFLGILLCELVAAERRARKKGLRLAVRLNLTSDLSWEERVIGGQNLMAMFPQVQFYDYTKIPARMRKFLRGAMPPNYHLTFSVSEKNLSTALDIAAKGGNIAAVFSSDRGLPPTFNGIQVINADEHDLRFLDPRPCVAGLLAKGKAKHDTTGFVIPTP